MAGTEQRNLTYGDVINTINVTQILPGFGISPKVAKERGLNLEQDVTIDYLWKIVAGEANNPPILTEIFRQIALILYNKKYHGGRPIELNQGRSIVLEASEKLKGNRAA